MIQFDLKGHFIAEYPSAVKASEITGIGKSAIRECLYKRTATSGNFIWLFKNDPILDKQGQPGNSVKDIQIMDTDKRRCG